jgi:hypothetical protein
MKIVYESCRFSISFAYFVSDYEAPLKKEETKILDDYSVSYNAGFIGILNNLISFNRKSST